MGIIIGTQVTLNLSSKVVGECNDEANFSHKLFLTNTQVSRIRKAFADVSSANIKFLKTQLSKMVQVGGFLGRLLGPLLKTGLPLMGNALKPLTKSVLVLLGLMTAASATDAAIQKKIFGSAGFYPSILVYSRFPQRFSFFSVSLVHCHCEVSPWWTPKERFLKFRSPDCWKMHF